MCIRDSNKYRTKERASVTFQISPQFGCASASVNKEWFRKQNTVASCDRTITSGRFSSARRRISARSLKDNRLQCLTVFSSVVLVWIVWAPRIRAKEEKRNYGKQIRFNAVSNVVTNRLRRCCFQPLGCTHQICCAAIRKLFCTDFFRLEDLKTLWQ